MLLLETKLAYQGIYTLKLWKGVGAETIACHYFYCHIVPLYSHICLYPSRL